MHAERDIRGTRFEVSTSGFDETLQLVAGDPYGVGLRIPFTPTPPQPTGNQLRYMFLLARHRVPMGVKLRLVGMRQLLTIGMFVPRQSNTDQQPVFFPAELEVTSPQWRFSDGQVTWYVRRLPPLLNKVNQPQESDSFAFREADTPALLFESVTSFAGGGSPIVGYVPPYGGEVRGVPLDPTLNSLHDIRFPWREDQAWSSLDIECEGPCDIALFALVTQTNPNTRVSLQIPQKPINCCPVSKEDAFVSGLTIQTEELTLGPVYWRIGGALIFEYPDMLPVPANPEVRDIPQPLPSTNAPGAIAGIKRGG